MLSQTLKVLEARRIYRILIRDRVMESFCAG